MSIGLLMFSDYSFGLFLQNYELLEVELRITSALPIHLSEICINFLGHIFGYIYTIIEKIHIYFKKSYKHFIRKRNIQINTYFLFLFLLKNTYFL